MQSNDYIKKYKSIFQDSEVDTVISRVINLPDLNCTNDKYGAIQRSQIINRSNSFTKAVGDAIRISDISPLRFFVSELNEISIRNTNAAQILVDNYLAILVSANGIIDRYRVALDFLNELSAIRQASCVEKCIACYVTFINKFDDMGSKQIADEFYSYAERIAPKNAWIRFRKFRLGLGCNKNSEFVYLDKVNYKDSGEGASIYHYADEKLKELFRQQSATYGKRVNKEKKERDEKEAAERERQRQDDAARLRRFEKSWARKKRVKAFFKFILTSLPLALSLLFIITHILFFCSVSPISDFWAALYIGMDRDYNLGWVIDINWAGAISAFVFVCIFAIFQIVFLVCALKDDFNKYWFDGFDDWHLPSFLLTLVGIILCFSISIPSMIYYKNAVNGESISHHQFDDNYWDKRYSDIIYYNNCYFMVDTGEKYDYEDYNSPAENDYYCHIERIYSCSGDFNFDKDIPKEFNEHKISYAINDYMEGSNIVNLTISNDAPNMGFRNNDKLKTIIFTDGVTQIDGFYDNKKLESVTIPSSVKYIGEYALARCENLSSIYYAGTKEQWNTIVLGAHWCRDVGDFTVYCTDGKLSLVGRWND